MAKVLLEEVTKDFGEVIAVNKANINIQDREFLVLVGPSGCGKSTTLRMVAGLEEISDGKIFIGDRLVNDVPPKDRDIAMVFQNYALYPHMNVFNNMAFGLKLRKMPKDQIETRVKEAANLLGIQELLERKPKQLSGGQRQRVALGRAIVREPKVFLMDEPLSNLDAKLRVQMRTELSKLHDRLQTTVIYVTHDQTEAMTMGDRLVVMKDGFIQQVDTPINLYNNPVNMFVAGFIGSPAMNLVPCRLVLENENFFVTSENYKLGLAENTVTERLREFAGQEVIFGIRPEDIFDASLSPEIEVKDYNKSAFKVEVIEPMGSETFTYLNMDGETVTARMEVETKARIGEPLEVAFNMKNAHIFDPETEDNLTVTG